MVRSDLERERERGKRETQKEIIRVVAAVVSEEENGFKSSCFSTSQR